MQTMASTTAQPGTTTTMQTPDVNLVLDSKTIKAQANGNVVVKHDVNANANNGAAKMEVDAASVPNNGTVAANGAAFPFVSNGNGTAAAANGNGVAGETSQARTTTPALAQAAPLPPAGTAAAAAPPPAAGAAAVTTPPTTRRTAAAAATANLPQQPPMQLQQPLPPPPSHHQQQQPQFITSQMKGPPLMNAAANGKTMMPNLNGITDATTTTDAKGQQQRKVSCQDIQLVQNMIERCMQLYMSQKEVVNALHTQAHVEPTFTMLVWQKLEASNPAFFRTYYTWLRIKDQVVAYNYLVDQHNALAHKGAMVGAGNHGTAPSNGGWIGQPQPPMPHGGFNTHAPPVDAGGWGPPMGGNDRNPSLPPWFDSGSGGVDGHGGKNGGGNMPKNSSTNSLDLLLTRDPSTGNINGFESHQFPGNTPPSANGGGRLSFHGLGLGPIPRNLSISDLSLDICREFNTDDAAMLNLLPAMDEMGGGGGGAGGRGGSGAADGGTEGGGAGGAGKAVPESGLSLEHIGKNFSLTEFNCFEGAFEKA